MKYAWPDKHGVTNGQRGTSAEMSLDVVLRGVEFAIREGLYESDDLVVGAVIRAFAEAARDGRIKVTEVA